MTQCRIDGCESLSLGRSSLCQAHISYAIRGDQKVKIGVSRFPEERFYGLRTGVGEALTLSGFVRAPRDLEAMILHRLAPDRLRGEWFRDTEQVRAFERLIAAEDIDGLWRLIHS